mmetsp:Transcript_12766/g.33442  ORF Transcript_12766/g.33442 Transcript_12766/m.33442 type:complete len:398 (+) Transcript_12766:484-1677(+)
MCRSQVLLPREHLRLLLLRLVTRLVQVALVLSQEGLVRLLLTRVVDIPLSHVVLLRELPRVLVRLLLPPHDVALRALLLRLPLFALHRLLVGTQVLVLDADRLQLLRKRRLLAPPRRALGLDGLMHLELRLRQSLLPLALRLLRRILGSLALRRCLRRGQLAHCREPLDALREVRLPLLLVADDASPPFEHLLRALLLHDSELLPQLRQRHLLEQPQLREVGGVQRCHSLARHELERSDLLDEVGALGVLRALLLGRLRLEALRLFAELLRLESILPLELFHRLHRPLARRLHVLYQVARLVHPVLLLRLKLAECVVRLALRGHRERAVLVQLASARLLGLLVSQDGRDASPLDLLHSRQLILRQHPLLPRVELRGVTEFLLVSAQHGCLALLLLPV